MDPKTIAQIVAWIRARCIDWDDDDDSFYPNQRPEEVFSKFIADPALIDEYPLRSDIAVPDGCAYFYRKGEKEGLSCGYETVPGTNRCSHHSHVIFSDATTAYINQQHDVVRAAYDAFGVEEEQVERDKWKAEKERYRAAREATEREWTAARAADHLAKMSAFRRVLLPEPSPPPVQLQVKIIPGVVGIYREPYRGLLVRHDGDGPLCIGYSLSETCADPMPLTEDLKAYCRSIELKYE